MTTIRVAHPGELEAVLALRERIFVDEQGVAREDDVDGRDEEATHLVALAGERVVATCRLLCEGDVVKLGRMAVARPARGTGLGTELLREAERWARAQGARRVVLAAQLGARGFYDRAGYAAHGEVFLDAGIEHLRMEKAVA